jgi:N-acetylneuraminic acid mutarotase
VVSVTRGDVPWFRARIQPPSSQRYRSEANMSTRWTLVLALALASGCGGDSDPDPGPGPGCPDTQPGPGWSAAPAVLGGAIQETAVVALDGKVYVLGGFNGRLGIVPSVRVYDTAACTWSDGPDLPRAVHHANAAVWNGTIYVVGSMETGSFTAIGDVWAWNPSTDAGWTVHASMPAGTQRGAAVAGAIDGRIYVAGGLRGGAQGALSAYTIASDSWDTALPALPQIRDHGCGGAVGGKLYVVGGRAGGVASISGLVFEYTPGGTWVQKASMPTARGGVACGVDGDRIVVAGGEGNPSAPSGVFPQVEAYTVSADRWDTLDPMPTPRHGMGGAISGGVFYVPGGASREMFGAVDTHEALQL